MDMDSCLDTSINSTMRDYLDNFFVAVQEGNTTYNSFLAKLSTFNDTVRTHHSKLRGETLSAVNSFVSVIRIVATDILELRTVTEKSINESTIEISKILNRKMGNLTITDDWDLKTSKGQPAYIKPSYQWLLYNLHNPYPSKEVKKDISRQTKCSLKDIDAWFVDARKRIGWNKLRKTRFSNKQEQIVAAATHIFKPKPSTFSDDPNATLLSEMDPRDEHRGQFLAMAQTARSLYADKFPELMPSLSWTHFVNHVSPEATPKNFIQKNINPSATPFLLDSRHSYPTPEPSPQSHLTDEPPAANPFVFAQNSQCQSRKRRLSIGDIDTEGISNRSSKRFRSDVLEPIDILSPTSLPSPSRTVDDLSDNTSEDNTLFSSATECVVAPEMQSLKRKRGLSDAQGRESAKHPHISTTPDIIAQEPLVISEVSRLKRKRRLSEGESQCIPKRPHNSLAQPRLQTVSDPFPMAKFSLGGSFTSLSEDGGVVEGHTLETPLPALITEPLEAPNIQQIVPSTYPEPCSAEYLSYFVNEEPPVSVYVPENSELFSTFVAPSLYLDTLPDISSNIVVSTANFPDFNGFYSAQEIPPTQLTSMNDDLSHWLASMQSDNPCDAPNPLGYALSSTVNNHEVYTESLDAKRAKLQALREQVSQLEGQLAGQLMA